MNPEQYQYITSPNFLVFEFISEGPNGKIKKAIRYSPLTVNGITYFNLGFGDMNEQTGQINDLAISNNNDRDRILATVAASVLDFTTHFPDAIIYVQGSTPARTRLYQIAILNKWEQVTGLFEVLGFINVGWESFAKNVNYHAFLCFRKKS